MNINSSFIHDSPKLETTQVSFYRYMIQQKVVYAQCGILLSTKKEWTGDKCNNMDGPQENYANLKRLYIIPFM